MTDPISDMLNRIRNAQGVEKSTLEIPFSNVKYEIAKILTREGFIKKAETKGRKINKVIEVELKYQDKIPAISGTKKISK
ncbi:MAG: 30S ribosomal protein S8, partial [bacterium]|nr:30S ribosomal protein S8 [bacterium]